MDLAMNVEKMNLKRFMVPAVMLAIMVLMIFVPEMALASGTDGTFDETWDKIVDWSQGSLGRVIAGAFVIVGIVMGIARQSLMAFAVGMGAGLGLTTLPAVLEEMFSTTLEAAATATPAILQVSNGLM